VRIGVDRDAATSLGDGAKTRDIEILTVRPAIDL
jgi:hypothetical protein